MRKISLIFFILGLMTSLPALSQGLVGTYSAVGTNPGGSGQYKGRVKITQSEGIYYVRWQVGATYRGTGIRTGNVLSVAYTDANRKWFGIVSYQILDDGNRLQGQWCEHNGRLLGTELLVKRR